MIKRQLLGITHYNHSNKMRLTIPNTKWGSQIRAWSINLYQRKTQVKRNKKINRVHSLQCPVENATKYTITYSDTPPTQRATSVLFHLHIVAFVVWSVIATLHVRESGRCAQVRQGLIFIVILHIVAVSLQVRSTGHSLRRVRWRHLHAVVLTVPLRESNLSHRS